MGVHVIKLFGAAILLALGGLFALRGGTVYLEGLRQAEGFLALLRHIRERIACYRTPTPELFCNFQNAALRRAGILSAVGTGDFLGALAASADRLYLDGEEYRALSAFAAELGSGFAEEEIARCDLAIRRMEEAVTARRAALPRAVRLHRTLSLSAAAALVLLLI